MMKKIWIGVVVLLWLYLLYYYKIQEPEPEPKSISITDTILSRTYTNIVLHESSIIMYGTEHLKHEGEIHIYIGANLMIRFYKSNGVFQAAYTCSVDKATEVLLEALNVEL